MAERPLEDWEFPDADEADEDDSYDTAPCPACGAEIFDDAEQCPACGEYVEHSTAGAFRRPGWLITLGLVSLALVMLFSVVRVLLGLLAGRGP